ncbi:MAG: LysM peptidoglycan-binding domain-containing protein, partial [Gammaproteobacteria bacterium]|nr:LysM peptidoglycan-binding domain-containing protein [Gammaproteobacteria bacterium]
MRKLTLSLAVLAALMPGRGYPLGLGEIELNSALNQELNAEIEVLSAVAEDAEQLIVKLASREAFARAGIDRPYMLQDLKFSVIVKNNKPYVRVFTKTAVREPFLSFLVEIDWPEGHLLREYTLLLDPPVFSGGSAAATATDTGRPFIDPADLAKTQPAQTDNMMQGRPAQAAYPQSQPMQATQQATTPVVITSPDTGRQVTYQVMPQRTEVSGNYRVQQNDTLWGIANRTKPDNSISVEQMMLALVRKNPEAFIKENINGVKRGYILRMPDRAEITAVDRQTALAQAREHSALWREYRQTMSGAIPASSMEAEQTGQADSLVEDSTEGKLSIVSASDIEGSETAASGQDPQAQLNSLRQQLSLAQESLESERLEKTELKARLAELEQRVQGVLSMDDGELAKLQSDLEGVKQVTTEAAVVEEEKAEEP